MTEAFTSIVAQLDGLSQQERAELARVGLLSLEGDGPGVEEAWERELDRRVARIRGGETEGIPVEQFFADWRRGRS